MVHKSIQLATAQNFDIQERGSLIFSLPFFNLFILAKMPSNRVAWLTKADAPLEVREAPMPTAGAGEIVVRNFAIAINPLDNHMQKTGLFVKQWPAIFGCDVAGEVHEVGAGAASRFKKGDRVIG